MMNLLNSLDFPLIIYGVLALFVIYISIKAYLKRDEKEKEDNTLTIENVIPEIISDDFMGAAPMNSFKNEPLETAPNDAPNDAPLVEDVKVEDDKPNIEVSVKIESIKKESKPKVMKIISNPKYQIFKGKGKSKGYYFRLLAKNGKIILKSEGYKTLEGAKGGVDSVIENCTSYENFNLKDSVNKQYYFTLESNNGEIIGVSETYKIKKSAEKGIESVRKNGKTQNIERIK